MIVRDIKAQGGRDSVPAILRDAQPDIVHKYYSLHGSGTSHGILSLSETEFRALAKILPSQINAPIYEDLYRQALAHRRSALFGDEPSFYRMDLHKPPKGSGWHQNIIRLAEEYGLDFQPPTMVSVNGQIDLYIHGVRSVHGEIAALDAAYSLLRVHDLYSRKDTPSDRVHVRLTLLYHTIDLAAQIGAHRHLGFLIGEIARTRAGAVAGTDLECIIRRMDAYCRAQIKCVSPPRRLTTSYLKALNENTDEAVGAWDAGKVSEEIALHLSPLIAGWAGAHFQRVAARIRTNPTQGEFDEILDQHDDVAGTLATRFPSRLSFPLFSDCRRNEDYSNAYVAEILALRALMPVDRDEEAGRGANGLYPLNARLAAARSILDKGLDSTQFVDRTHDAIRAEMLHWKLVLILSSYFKTRSQTDRLAYAETKNEAREVMGRLGMGVRLEDLERFQEINAGYRL